MSEIEDTPDEALLATVRSRAYERVVKRMGCLTAAALSTVPAAWAAMSWTGDLEGVLGSAAHGVVFTVAGLCSFPMVALLFGPLLMLRRLRAGKEIAELRRRWGQDELSTYERRAALMLAAGGSDAQGRRPPDYVVLFQGKELPSGGHRFLRLDLWGTELPRAEAELRRSHPVIDAADADPQGSLSVVRGDVPETVVSALAEKLATLDGDLEPGRTAKDGLPCSCAVLRRDPPDVFHATANLATTPSTHPAAGLLGLLMAASEALIAGQEVAGAADTT
jgi:hypothetical protein